VRFNWKPAMPAPVSTVWPSRSSAGYLVGAGSVLLAGLVLSFLAALGPGRAHAAGFDAWRHCMQLSNEALSETACSTIIDAPKESDDNLAYAYLYRARAEASCFRKGPAITDFTAALQRDPTLVHPWYGLGQLAMTSQDYVGAEQAFGKAIEAKGEDADIDRFTPGSPGIFRYEPLRARGYARYKKGDMAGALVDLTAAIKICPTCATPYQNRGVVLAHERQIEEAFADFNRAIALNPRAVLGFYLRGFVLARMQKYDQAIANFSEAVRLSPVARGSYRARADAYTKLGKTKEAEEDIRRADAIDTEVKNKRRANCGAADPDAEAGTSEDEAETAAPPADPTALNDAALTALLSGKKWPAKQGIWSVEAEFRYDGTFRQRASDTSQNGKLQVTTDGGWVISQGRLCLFTNALICMTGRSANGTLTLTRSDGTIEYSGPDAKLQSISLDNATAPIKEYPLDEKFVAAPQAAAGSPNKAPKTLLYYIHGLPISPRMHNPALPYFVEQIRKVEGWDVIDADFPLRIDTQYMVRDTASTFAAAAHVARRIKELKAKGYQRIFVAGQMMGGWAALALSTEEKLPLDGILMIAPACCSPRTSEETGDPSPDFQNNNLYYEQLIKHDRYPTVAVFFANDAFDPGGRGEATTKALGENKLASLVIDKPQGFSGEGAVWLPVFDYSYRQCITAFLKAPSTTQCPPRKIASADFRTTFFAKQITDLKSRIVDPASLVGKEFAAYPSGEILTIASADSTILKSAEAGERTVPSAFRDGKFCVRQKVRFRRPINTDEHCYIIVKWSDRELFLMNPQASRVIHWAVANDGR
jgi:tetratricopeptide (TPR) repeat protein/pimeloyl-ACP methyl ester carboxylesterase